MTERDVAPEPGPESGAAGAGAPDDRTGSPGGSHAGRRTPDGGSGSLLSALTRPSPIRVIRRPNHQTAALRQKLAEKAAATNELREALDELRQVLDVENPPLTPGPHRHRRWLVVALIGFAAIAVILVLLNGRNPEAIVSPADSSPATSVPPGPLASTPPPGTSPAAAQASAGAVRPLPWPGGAVILPRGLTTTGPGASEPGTDVQAAVDGDGAHIDVIERLVLDATTGAPLVMIMPSLPSLPALGDAQVTDLQVQLDDQTVTPTAGDDRTSWTVTPAPGRTYTRATLRYRIQDAVVQVTPAAPGRAFGLVTPLSAALSQAHGHAVVVRTLDPHVLGVSCPGVESVGSVCGTRTVTGWSALLPDTAKPIVLFQINR